MAETSSPLERNAPVRVHKSPFLPKQEDEKSRAIVLVILNTPIHRPPSRLFTALWDLASFRVCADGGANRLFDATVDSTNEDNPDVRIKYVPDVIRGDLDSLLPSVRDYYQEKGALVERDRNQDTHDLDKALERVQTQFHNSNNHVSVYIYGAFGGRFDQEMGCIQTLYRWGPSFEYRLSLYDDQTCAFLLPAGVLNQVQLPFFGPEIENRNCLVGEGPTCGLIPIGCKCDVVQTSGLKWDLDGSIPLEFGGMVSTSNRAMKPIITVQSSNPLIFTAETMAGING